MDLVLSARQGPITIITLNRPDRLNALVADMRDLLLGHLQAAEQDDSCRVVVITGAGRAFCAGGDVDTMSQYVEGRHYDELERLLHAGGTVVRCIRNSRLPVIAAVNGAAAGAGMNLALACDMRIASENATFSQAFIKIGLHPDWGGTWFLPRLVGPGRSMRMMMTGEAVKAQEALEMGLVEEVVPADRLSDTVHKLAQVIAHGSPRVLASIKRAVYRGHDVDLDSALAYEAQAQMTAFRTEDVAEGLQAFREKRRPVFNGR